MCSGPRLETSKPSILIGSSSSPSASRERGERVDPLLAAALAPQLVLGERELRVALGQLPQPALVAALGDPHLDRRRRGGSPAPRASTSARSRTAGPTTTSRGTAGAAE